MDHFTQTDRLDGDADPLTAGQFHHRFPQVLLIGVYDVVDPTGARFLPSQLREVGRNHLGPGQSEELGREIAHQPHSGDQDRISRLYRRRAQDADAHPSHTGKHEVLPFRLLGYGQREVGSREESP